MSRDTNPQSTALGRRQTLRGLTTTGLALLAASGTPHLANGDSASDTEPSDRSGDSTTGQRRQQRAFELRTRIAREALNLDEPFPDPETRWETDPYDRHISSYTKGLPHDEDGLVDEDAYEALRTAMTTGDPAAFPAIPLGDGFRQLKDPQSAFGFELVGPDPQQHVVPSPPAYDSEEMAAQVVDAYWRMLSLDVPFVKYDQCPPPVLCEAAAELASFDAYSQPMQDKPIRPGTMFELMDLPGPRVSQFMLKPYARGALQVEQKIRTIADDVSYLTDYDEWLSVRDGAAPTGEPQYDETERYVHDGRSLAEFVHEDVPNQAFDSAVLLLLGREAPVNPTMPFLGAPLDRNIPFSREGSSVPFVNFGFFDAIDAVDSMVDIALSAAWYNKWGVHDLLRPETYGGHVHLTKTGQREFPIDESLLESEAVQHTYERHGTYLLPQLYPEGAPMHPAYPSGHATVAGACATALKAYFDESYVFPNPVRSNADGTELVPVDAEVTIRSEADKLAVNVANGRIFAGVHYPVDAVEGLMLGEKIALSVLKGRKALSNQVEEFEGWELTRFDGTTVTI
ncbi:vanadium-dependent haloperoxidase [Haloarchaeobius sp. DFWS5]|uniref:vanadium-dependent haloperoxidase n=1 Tax=Haloarchaeobius sp. DFWS5 TaxID=3446114 RepID=UPI003EB9A789